MNPILAFQAESAYDDSLHSYRGSADRIMFGMNVFLTLVCLAIAPYRGTWSAFLLIAVPTLALSFALMRHRPGALMTRLFMACAFMAYTSLIIHQSGGDIEAHFSAFGLIGVLLYYRDWRTICAATVFIYLQHTLVGYAQTLGWPVYVFDTLDFWAVLPLHIAYFLPFVVMMCLLSIWLRREGYEQNRLIQESLLREQQMQDLMVKAEAANRLKSEILANISHEIRTPINGVSGMIQLVLDGELSLAQRGLLDSAFESSGQLIKVINNILDFSKIEMGAIDMVLTPCHVRPLFEDIERLFEMAAAEKNLGFEVVCEPELPDQLLMAPNFVRQILINLVGNAIKFTHQGRVDVWVKTHLTDDVDQVVLCIQVQDTGIGFSNDQIKTLFHPFVQADGSSTREYGGTGLGLAITRSLVQRMGGQVHATGDLGRGALFEVELPCTIHRPAEPAVALPPTHDLPQPPVAKDILLVEDHAVNQRVMALMLQRLGHRVSVAENGRVALDRLQERRFDLILLDVMMPVMDGLQMLKELRAMEQHKGDPHWVVMVTAHALAGDEAKFLEMGANGYLPKPVSMETLKAEIARFMAHASAHAVLARNTPLVSG